MMTAAKKDRTEELKAALDPERLPYHVAIIMDGNGRWAQQHGLRSRIQGHRAGVKAVRRVTETAARLGIKVLTLYAFSKENWQRPQKEIDMLMRLLQQYLTKELTTLQKNNIRLIASGDLDDLPRQVRQTLNDVIRLTAKEPGMILNLALSYGGRQEIVRAVRLLTRETQQGTLSPTQIDTAVFARYLYHPELPDPDLLIRTSGELRLSNFLLWQLAYSELYITPVLWPDFQPLHLFEAIVEYQRRERRFGGVPR